MAYTGFRSVTIDHTKVGASDSTNFPFLFSGVYAYLAGTGNGGEVTSASGYDIVFASDAMGMNLLNWEIETYDSVTGTVNFWINIPTLSHTANTVIYVFYGNASITTFQGGATGAAWNANFSAVYHLASATSQKDSTTNANTGIPSNITAATGKIDGACTFNGTNSVSTVPSSASLQVVATFSAWVNPSALVNQAFIAKGAFDYIVAVGVTASGDISLYDPTSGWVSSTGGVVGVGAWQHVCAIKTGTSDLFYYNGALISTVPNVNLFGVSATSFYIGAANASIPFTGNLDEIHVSSVVRSTDWILAEYNNQNNPITFYTLSAPLLNAYSVPDCRNYGHFPNSSRNLNATLIYDVQTSSNSAVPGTDSRTAGAPIDSSTQPQNSRTPGTYGPGE